MHPGSGARGLETVSIHRVCIAPRVPFRENLRYWSCEATCRVFATYLLRAAGLIRQVRIGLIVFHIRV
ncbi:hypothetical protein SAMN05421878_1055 [Actinobaculum suis]|uniref:Uncharacterized protein n=1 Tax=Actinobaculum suis TaxID=1657 RepID=A0A1G7BHV0_9ACTO|nr:hypothetical protein SAMN05421878_1055 [Actinobaculum suis]VDG76570.1 Uncharacterised protein [Actinobaculum suis]